MRNLLLYITCFTCNQSTLTLVVMYCKLDVSGIANRCVGYRTSMCRVSQPDVSGILSRYVGYRKSMCRVSQIDMPDIAHRLSLELTEQRSSAVGHRSYSCRRFHRFGHRLSAIGHRPAVIGYRPSHIITQPSVIRHRLSCVDHRASTVEHRSSIAGC